MISIYLQSVYFSRRRYELYPGTLAEGHIPSLVHRESKVGAILRIREKIRRYNVPAQNYVF